MTFPGIEDILKNDETIFQMTSLALHTALTTHNNPEVLSLVDSTASMPSESRPSGLSETQSISISKYREASGSRGIKVPT